VRVLPEEGRAADDVKEVRQSPIWPEELRFETDVMPWKSPFQDDPDALERLIRETDGQKMEMEDAPVPMTDRAVSERGMMEHVGMERGADAGRIHPVPDRQPETGAAEPMAEPEFGGVARIGGYPSVADGGMPPIGRDARSAGEDGAPAGYYARRRRPPAPSWMRVAATVAGAVLTGALFGYLVMSLLFWQPGTPPQEEAGLQPEEEADIVLPADSAPDGGAGQSEASPAAVEIPAVRYYVLQYGVFSTEAGLAEALAQLKAAGYAGAADTADGFRAYAGIAESREAAEALAARLDGIELYIRPLEVPASGRTVPDGQPEDAAAFLLRTNELVRMMSGLSASLLAAGGTNPFPAESWSDWQTSHRSWTEAAASLPDGLSADSGIGRLSDALDKAAEAFAAYQGKPAPEHLWNAQSALMEAAIAQRDWMRSSGAL